MFLEISFSGRIEKKKYLHLHLDVAGAKKVAVRDKTDGICMFIECFHSRDQ